MKNKVVVITGGSSGIGFACAESFCKKGAHVVISGRDPAKLINASKILSDQGGSVMAIEGDVGVEADCKRLIDETIKKFNRIDILINNAGISMRSLFLETKLEVLRKIMDTNFWGSVYCTKFALPFILENKGSVVGISSIAGKIGLPARSGYSASKFAMEGFLQTLRNENIRNGLHVLVVCPGFTASNIRKTALSGEGEMLEESPRDEQKMMQASEVAEAITRAIDSGQKELILSTEGKLAVWLKKFFPGFVDTMVFRKMLAEKNSPLNK